ncbi:MAG: hypothetical protein H6636_14635, partial [Anaerolineales bacterium]|nr:hypothetical protein [Anaerolineales bacterium]
LQAREVKDGLPEFQVGPTVYRGLWVVDGHFILEAARYLGHAQASEQGINALLRRVRPDGSIMQLGFHPKETGISLTTLIRHCELDDDWARLETLWPVIQRAVAYIRHLRDESKKRGPGAAEYGLMPPAFGDGGLGGWRPEYTTALWTLVGLKKAAWAAQKLNHLEDAVTYQAEFEDLLAIFREKATRDMRTLPDGTPYLPMSMPGASSDHIHDQDYPDEVSPRQRINPGTATWALAHAIYPGEVFAPDDPLVQNFCKLLDQLDDEEGIPANTGWLPHDALWTYAASFYAHVWLYAERPDKAIDYLYAFADHATPTRVWREEQSLRRAAYALHHGDMPHNWASAEFIRLVRHLLVFERGDHLEILPALPDEWLQPGAEIKLETTPTRFGPVDLSLTFDKHGDAVLRLGMNPAWSVKPAKITVHVPAWYAWVQREKEKAIPNQSGTITVEFAPSQIIYLRRDET